MAEKRTTLDMKGARYLIAATVGDVAWLENHEAWKRTIDASIQDSCRPAERKLVKTSSASLYSANAATA